MNPSTRLFSLVLPLLASASSSFAAQLYVSTTGSDTNTCTQSAPCRQIRRAISRAAAGDTINVADGSYQGFTIDGFTASAAAPLTIVSATRNAQVLPTSDRGDNEANIYVTDSSYVVIDGLRSFNGPSFGVRISHSPHITVRNGVFGNNGMHGIFTGHSDDLLIEGNECYGSATSHGIYVSNSGDRPIVRRNISHDNVKAGIQLNADASESGDGIISGALIEANVIYNNSGDSSAINLDGVQDSIVRNNLIYNNHETAITFFQGDAAAGPRGNQVLNNTIDVPTDGRSGLVFRDSVGPNVVRNNILYNRSSGTGLKFGNSTDLSNSDSDYNVVDRLSADDGDTVLSLTQWKAQGRETHSLSATPAALWVSPGVDYHLASSSPAIDHGQTLAAVTTDFDGKTRPAGASSDIGAYEASGVVSSSQLSIADVRVTEGNSGTTNAVFVVTLSPAAASAVTVNWATANGTATSGSDYTAASGTLSFAAGETSKNVTVAVTGDSVVESDETFYVSLSNPGNATIARAQATGTITNDDVAAVTVSVNDVSVSEGNSGTTNAVLTVTLSAASAQAVTVNYATANGTASAGSDYTSTAGSLTFAAGTTSKTISVPIVGDSVVEPNETFVVNLSSPVGATLAKSQGVGTILNDDAQGKRPQRVWHNWFAVDKLETPMVGDFNGDRKMDIITFTRQNPLAVGDVYVALSDGAQFGPNSKWNDWFAISTDETVVIGDFDGDGKDDIATWLGKTSRQVYVALSTGSGMTTSTVWSNGLGLDATDVVVSGDVNGDGKKDLVCFARKQGKVYVARSDGTKFGTPTVWHNFFAVSTYERPRVADVNGDGKADIVTFATDSPTAYGDVYVALSDGTKFVDQNKVPNSSTKWHDWFAINPSERIQIGDLDGDGKADFLTFLQPPLSQCYTVRSQGNAMAANVLWPETIIVDPTDVPFVGDVNGDSKADVVIFAQGEGKVYVSMGR